MLAIGEFRNARSARSGRSFWTGPAIRPIARVPLGLVYATEGTIDLLDPGVVSRDDIYLGAAPCSSTHPLSARERSAQRDRRRDRIVHRDLDHVRMHHCAREALARAADHELLQLRRARRHAERHRPAAVVEARRLAVLAVRHPHDRRAARSGADEYAPPAVVT